jgi:hypothetical protein
LRHGEVQRVGGTDHRDADEGTSAPLRRLACWAAVLLLRRLPSLTEKQVFDCVLCVPQYPGLCVFEARPVRGKDRVHSSDNTLTAANLLSACPADNRHHRKECS